MEIINNLSKELSKNTTIILNLVQQVFKINHIKEEKITIGDYASDKIFIIGGRNEYMIRLQRIKRNNKNRFVVDWILNFFDTEGKRIIITGRTIMKA